MAPSDRRLMFCVGATKAGTTWLYDQLRRHPECHLRTLKELHYFDSLEFGRMDQERRKIEGMARTLTEKYARVDDEKRRELTVRIRDRNDWAAVLGIGHEDIGAYLGYLYGGAGDAEIVGDVTPAYGLLPEVRLRQMAGLTGDVRFVYLMRDPVDRLWSHVRMNAQRKRGGGELDEDLAHRMLKQTIEGRHEDITLRSDYRAVLERLDRVVARDKLLVMFYEDLVAPGGLEALCAFLGIGERAGETGEKVHAGAPATLKHGWAKRARAWLDAQYEYVADRMGGLPPAWRALEAKV